MAKNSVGLAATSFAVVWLAYSCCGFVSATGDFADFHTETPAPAAPVESTGAPYLTDYVIKSSRYGDVRLYFILVERGVSNLKYCFLNTRLAMIHISSLNNYKIVTFYIGHI